MIPEISEVLEKNTKKARKKILLFFLMFTAITVFVAIPKMTPEAAAGTTVSSLQKQINEKKASATASANKKKQLEAQIAALKNQQAIAINDKKLYDELIDTIDKEIEIRKGIVEDNEKLIQQIEIEIKTAEEEYEKSYNLFLDILKLSYEEGDINYLSLLMGSEDFTDFLSNIDILSSMIEYNKTIIEKVSEDKELYEDKKTSLEDILKQQNNYITGLAEDSTQVESWINAAEEKINNTGRAIEENIASQAQFEQEEKDAQNEIVRLQKEKQVMQEKQAKEANQKNQSTQKNYDKYVGGPFLWPVDIVDGNGRKTYISSPFGYRISPITGRREFHNGIDLPRPYGSNIYAVNDGTILIMTYATGYGNYVVIDHGGGIATMYAHASSFNKNLKVGSTVKRGDVIAYVGSTGWSTGNHLHFALLKNGEYLNPMTNGFVLPN